MNDKSKPALSLVTLQARHHYTRFDQVRQPNSREHRTADEDIAVYLWLASWRSVQSARDTNPGQPQGVRPQATARSTLAHHRRELR